MAGPIFQCFVAVLLLGLVTSENSSQKNEKTKNIEIEPAMSRLIRPQGEKNLEEASSSRNAHEAGSVVQKREAEKPKEELVKNPHTKETGSVEPKETNDTPDLTVGESRLELSLPSFKEAPPRRIQKSNERIGRARPMPRHQRNNNQRAPPGPPPRQATRRNGYQGVDFSYDPRPDQRPTQNIYPIPIEFINQIPGAQQPFQEGSIRVEADNYDFNPSAQIEQIVNGVPTVIDSENSIDSSYTGNFILENQPPTKASEFTLEAEYPQDLLDKNPTVRSLPATPEVIFREEYPNPNQKVNTPYSQVPYHDSRHTTEKLTSAGPTPTIQIAQDKVLHYMAPPNQALNYRVPPVIVDNSTPHPHPKTGLKTGYFPPSTRVMPRVSHIEAECRDDFMKLRVAFNDSFSGLIYSAGYTHDHDCMYINGTGQNTYEFYIQLNRCGTLGGSDHHKRDVKNTTPTKNYMWNTVTIQYSPLIEEEWDEHFKVTCEYGYDFWKTVTFPFLEVETNTADPVVFTLTPPECFMEIRSGYGLNGNRITGPVHVGDPITLLIYMRSQWDGFDMLVNDCVAHNGANKKIQLIDHHGCPVDEKLIAMFQGTSAQRDSMYETVIYAHMKTFRFTGTPALYIECDIRMCHGKCPTQPCNWRDTSPAVKRRKRSVGNITAVTDPEDFSPDEDQFEELATKLGDPEDAKKNTSFSESLSLFQSIQVLANEEDEKAFKNETASRVLVDEADYCFSSMLFTSAVAAITALLILSGLSITLLCARVRRERKGGKESAADVVHTLRSVRSARSEYIHSPQARIP